MSNFTKKIDKSALVKYILLVAVVLTVLGAVILTGSYAKYNTQGGGSDGARVAYWSVDVSDEGPTAGDPSHAKVITLKPDQSTDVFRFNPTNTKGEKITETLTDFTVTVTFPEAINTAALGVAIVETNPDTHVDYEPVAGFTTEDNKSFTFKNENGTKSPKWRLQPGVEQNREMKVVFNLIDSTQYTAKSYYPITVTVNYSQVTK